MSGKDLKEKDPFGDEIMLDEDEMESVNTSNEEVDVVKGEVVASGPRDLSIGGFNFNPADLEGIPSVVVGDIGMKISRLPVERAKFTKDSRALINLVVDKVTAVKVHYTEELGSFLCFGGECCDHAGLARVKYLFPINMYDSDKRGKPVSQKLTPYVLAVGQDAYDDLMTIAELNGDLSQLDILVSCKDEQYQKLSFQQAGRARSRFNSEYSASLKESQDFWNANFKNIVKSTARLITRAEFMKSLDEKIGTAGQPAKDVDFDSVFDS